MATFIKQNRYYVLTIMLLWVVAFPIHFLYGDPAISIKTNSLHTPILDWICYFGTHIGDGLFAVLISVFFLLVNRKVALVVILSYLLSAGITQSLKHFVFNEALRPSLVLDLARLHVVQGLNLHGYNSFPSGHTTSAFALFSALAFVSANKKRAALFVFPAVFVAFTRIYLLQHFYVDTLAGSIIGTLSAAFVIILLNRIKANDRSKTLSEY